MHVQTVLLHKDHTHLNNYKGDTSEMTEYTIQVFYFNDMMYTCDQSSPSFFVILVVCMYPGATTSYMYVNDAYIPFATTSSENC